MSRAGPRVEDLAAYKQRLDAAFEGIRRVAARLPPELNGSANDPVEAESRRMHALLRRLAAATTNVPQRSAGTRNGPNAKKKVPEPPGEASQAGISDGARNYWHLADAVAQASAGATVHLRGGAYPLEELLAIDKSLHFVGAGIDATRIVGVGEGALLEVVSGALVAIDDLTLEYRGTAGGHVVVARDSEIALRRCRVTGAVATSEHPDGSGVALFGSSRGVIEQCQPVSNDVHGIMLADDAHASLVGNLCASNGESGIAYFGRAGGRAFNNTCRSNGLHGFALVNDAQPSIERNSSRENSGSGLAYFDSAAGMATDNDCEANAFSGIWVGGEAHPQLANNRCRLNQASGITYADHGAGRAIGNHCERNMVHGIDLLGDACPSIEANDCSANKDSGIVFSGCSSGEVRKNLCGGNSGNGIALLDAVTPTLEQNQCLRNGYAGIVYYDQAGGVAKGNSCRENEAGAIVVLYDANPTIEDNDCD